MLKFRKILAGFLFISLSATAMPVLADNEISARNFGTPHHSMRYDMRADNEMAVQYIKQSDKADCAATYMTICWAQKLPVKSY